MPKRPEMSWRGVVFRFVFKAKEKGVKPKWRCMDLAESVKFVA